MIETILHLQDLTNFELYKIKERQKKAKIAVNLLFQSLLWTYKEYHFTLVINDL